MNFKKWVIISILLFSITGVYAYSDSIKLLAVSSSSDYDQGVIAELSLTINPGSGKVYFDTASLTKLDTQLSIKISKEIACDYLINEIDCDNYDFLYSIQTDSSIIGGPSAGAAATILTISSLEQIPVNRSISITGTINSGGYIGNVGGINEKLDAAHSAGLDMVLIPYESSNISNTSIDVNKVYDVDQALYYFTNGRLGNLTYDYQINETELYHEYNNKMQKVSDTICSRMHTLKGEVDHNLDNIDEIYDIATDALNEKSYYSAASFCFRANILYQEQILNSSDTNYTLLYFSLLNQYNEEKDLVNSLNSTSLSNLQVTMIIKNRLNDVKYYLDEINLSLSNESSEISAYEFAYTIERLETINSWKVFFDDNENLQISKEKLDEVCLIKTEEAQNRLDYLDYIAPGFSEVVGLDESFNKLLNYDDSLECIDSAANIKARTDVILSILSNTNQSELYEIKNFLALKSIKDSIDSDFIPIMGFSYHEYAKSLHETNSTTDALIYLQQVIELNNINMLFSYNATSDNEIEFENNENVIFSIIILLSIFIFVAILKSIISKSTIKEKRQLQKEINITDLKRKIKRIK